MDSPCGVMSSQCTKSSRFLSILGFICLFAFGLGIPTRSGSKEKGGLGCHGLDSMFSRKPLKVLGLANCALSYDILMKENGAGRDEWEAGRWFRRRAVVGDGQGECEL